ncbi:MAG: HxsD-like protein [Eubacteriales bacterium]|nr:HxsD-like protein [Eubacteriales bacterium]
MKALKLSSDIFSLEKINYTKKVYSGYADITIENMEGYWQLLFENCKYDEALTVQEFENYLIGICG